MTCTHCRAPVADDDEHVVDGIYNCNAPAPPDPVEALLATWQASYPRSAAERALMGRICDELSTALRARTGATCDVGAIAADRIATVKVIAQSLDAADPLRLRLTLAVDGDEDARRQAREVPGYSGLAWSGREDAAPSPPQRYVLLAVDPNDVASYETHDTADQVRAAIAGRRRDFPGETIRVFRGVEVGVDGPATPSPPHAPAAPVSEPRESWERKRAGVAALDAAPANEPVRVPWQQHVTDEDGAAVILHDDGRPPRMLAVHIADDPAGCDPILDRARVAQLRDQLTAWLDESHATPPEAPHPDVVALAGARVVDAWDRYCQIGAAGVGPAIEALRAAAARVKSTADCEPVYRCVDCGAEMNEGERRTFTVCDACWEKAHPKPSPSGTMTFDDWFRAQFGDPPTEMDRFAVEECLRGCEARAREYRALLARIDEYETRRDAALKAWCARTVKL